MNKRNTILLYDAISTFALNNAKILQPGIEYFLLFSEGNGKCIREWGLCNVTFNNQYLLRH
jgi:hypothetical protein